MWNEGKEDRYPIDTAELINNLKQLEPSLVLVMGKALKIDMDFRPKSLVLLETKLERFSQEGKEAILQSPPHFLALAYYFGETLIRNVPNAAWHPERIHDILLLSLRIQQNNTYQEIRPVSRLSNMFQWPEKFGMYSVFEALMKLQGDKIDIAQFHSGQRDIYDKDGNHVFHLKKM